LLKKLCIERKKDFLKEIKIENNKLLYDILFNLILLYISVLMIRNKDFKEYDEIYRNYRKQYFIHNMYENEIVVWLIFVLFICILCLFMYFSFHLVIK